MAREKADIERYEYRQLLIPNSGRRAQEKALNKADADGWELVQIKGGGGWGKSTATLRRPRSPKGGRFAASSAGRVSSDLPPVAPSGKPQRGSYEYKEIQVPTGSKAEEDRILAGLAKDGWGVVSKNPAGAGPERTVRLQRKALPGASPRKPLKGKSEWGTVSVIVLSGAAVLLLANNCGGDEPARTDLTQAPVTRSTPTPSSEPSTTSASAVDGSEESGFSSGPLAKATQSSFSDSYGWPDEPFWSSITEFTDRDAPRVTVVTTLANKTENEESAAGICRAVASVLPDDATGVYVTAGAGGPFLAECDRPYSN